MKISLATLFLLTALPTHAFAQDRRGACESCRVSMQQVARLGEADGPGAIGGALRSIALDSRNRYWVLTENDLPLVFDSAGNFIAEVGSQGIGPAEFRYPVKVVRLAGDSMLIIDAGTRRATVVSPSLLPARTISLPNGQVWDVVVEVWPKRLVFNALFQGAAAAGWPLHLVDMSGATAQIVKSFGANHGEMRLGQSASLFQYLTHPREGRFWAGSMVRYEIQGWSSSGTLIKSVERTPEWFGSQVNPYSIGNRNTPPPPKMRGISDADGDLWIVFHVPQINWREAWVGVPTLPPSSAPREVPSGRYSPSPTKLLRTRIDVLDIENGTLLSSAFIDRLVMNAFADGYFAAWHEDANGVPAILIYRARLTRS